jgi:hypothetical protein
MRGRNPRLDVEKSMSLFFRVFMRLLLPQVIVIESSLEWVLHED